MEILVIQTAFPGDLFLSLPLLKQIRKYHPNAKLSLLCRKGLGSAFLSQGLVDQIFEIEKGSSKSYSQVKIQLQQIEFDFVISPHRSFRTALLIFSLKAKVKVGYKLWWNSLFFTHRTVYPTHLPDAQRQLILLREINEEFRKVWDQSDWSRDFMGSKEVSPLTFMGLKIPSWSSMETLKWNPVSNIVYLAPGSVWATKRWGVSSFQSLAKRILDQGFDVVVTGSPADQEICDQVARADSRIVNECGKTSLKDLMERFKSARALVANDSGAIHVAASVGLPTVAIFGPTVPEFGFRPWNSKSTIVQLNLGCRPCSPHGTQTCPLGTHACMKDLSADQVFNAFTDLVGVHQSSE